MIVLYFDQYSGAAHAKAQVKICALIFYMKKHKKEERRRKNYAKQLRFLDWHLNTGYRFYSQKTKCFFLSGNKTINKHLGASQGSAS